jgi:hypothetical protein
MAHLNQGSLQSYPQAKDRADSIALGQGWQWESLRSDPETVRLGAGEALVRPCQFVSWLDDECLPAPPEVVGAVDLEAFSSGTLTELRLRLLVIGMLVVLVRDDDAPGTIRGALAFVEEFGGKAAKSKGFAGTEPVLIEDFIAWRDCGRDLATWFAKRFVVSRLHAI